jgi:hypothetical protein
MRLAALFIAGTTLVAMPAPSFAQNHAAHSAHAVHDSIMMPIKAMFDGMRTRDTALMRSAFAPGAMLAQPPRPGQPLKFETVDGFIASVVGAPAGTTLDEKLFDPEIRVDGPLASVWTFYTFTAGEYSHCGVDAFHLMRTAGGWKITTVADTRRRTGCEVTGKKPAG